MDIDNNIYLFIYVFLWVLVLFKYQKKRQYFGASSIILSSYLVYAVCSWVLYNSQLNNGNYNNLSLGAFIYLFLMLLIAVMPAIKFREETLILQPPSKIVIDLFSTVFIVATLVRLPDIIMNMGEGLVLLMLDEDGGSELYHLTNETEREAIGGGISNIFAIIYNVFLDVGILVAFYYMTLKKKSKTLLWGYILAIISSLLLPLSQGLRTGVMMKSFNLLIAFFLMKPFLSTDIKKKIYIGGSIVMGFVILLFMLLTISRFGDQDSGTSGSMLSYIGQADLNFNMYALDANGIRYGDRTCNTFKILLGFDNVPKNIVETRDRYSSLALDDSVFSTFVGDFVLDFGPWITSLIFVFFSLFVCRKVRPKNRIIGFHQLVLVYFAMIVCMQGGMYLFYYSYGENLTIIAFAMAYFLFKYDYKRRTIMN